MIHRASTPTRILVALVAAATLALAVSHAHTTVGSPSQRTDVESYRMARSLALRGQHDRALQLLRGELERGFDTSVVLGDVAWTDLRQDPRLKALIREYASPQPAPIAPGNEPGVRIALELEVVAADGTPVAGALVYAYQTDSEGYYGPSPEDVDNPRLWAYARSGADGRLRLDSVMPGPYPARRVPSHVHLEIDATGFDHGVFEVLFDDDPLLGAAGRSDALRRGWPVVRLEGSPPTATARVTLPSSS